MLGVVVNGAPAFDISGRFEVGVSGSDWLVAADDFSMKSADHEWPKSTIRVEASLDDDGSIAMLDSKVSYLMLGDLQLIRPWLGEAHREQLVSLSPSGIIRNLEVTVSELGSDEPRFNIQAELDEAGFASTDGKPGCSGILRLVAREPCWRAS